jgi:hypothetical protein
MLGNLKSIDARLLARRCVGCGYDGALLRGGQAQRCARCGCDLRERPARSYAEMEGLLGQFLDEESTRREQREERLIHRWLAFLFLSMLLVIVTACLTAALLVKT